MNEPQTDFKEPLSRTHQAILIGGDLLVIISFVLIGRSSHSLSTTDIVADLTTALPFIIAWLLVTPWFGIYKSDVGQSWRKLVPRLIPAWAIAVPVGLVLRAVFLGRPIPGGIIPTFALISMTYIGLVTLIWRLAYIWWINRTTKHSAKVRGAEL